MSQKCSFIRSFAHPPQPTDGDAWVLPENADLDHLDLEPQYSPFPEDEISGDDDEIDDDLMAEIEATDLDNPAAQYGMDVDMLLSLGVDPVDATRFARKCMAIGSTSTFMEMYGRGGLSKLAESIRMDVKGLHALDFATQKSDGTHWDVSKFVDRQLAWDLVLKERSDWIVGSPPCTAFSLLNVGLNYPKTSAEYVERNIKEGLVHLNFVCKLYRHQHSIGKWFLHEHPNGALSWKTKAIKKILSLAGVDTVVTHQCMFGLTSRTSDGGFLPDKKPTKWMSNSRWMLESLAGKCDGSHVHQPLMGGRAAAAAVYPPELLRAILRGIARTRDNAHGIRLLVTEDRQLLDDLKSSMFALSSDGRDIPMVSTISDEPNTPPGSGAPPNVPPPDHADETIRESSIPLTSGGNVPIRYVADNFKTVYLDEYTGAQLPTHLVRAAMEVERHLASRSDGFKLVRMRWVICNKGDKHEYDVRARLVACEMTTLKTDDFYAATPPLEAKRLLFSAFSNVARRPENISSQFVLSFVDIKKAYVNGVPRRNLHLMFPKDMGIGGRYIAHVKRCVYGTRDAGNIWEDCYADALTQMGFVSNKSMQIQSMSCGANDNVFIQ